MDENTLICCNFNFTEQAKEGAPLSLSDEALFPIFSGHTDVRGCSSTKIKKQSSKNNIHFNTTHTKITKFRVKY